MAALLAGLAAAVPSAAQVGNGKIALSNTVGIYTANSDGSGLVFSRAGYGPRWSPDGSLLAFSRDEGNAVHLLVMNADGSGERTLAPDASLLSLRPWSPDGTEIAYLGRDDVYVVPSAGGTSRRLTFDGGTARPVWSPTGSHLVYSRWNLPNGQSALFVVDANGGTPTQITSGGPDFIEEPAWSPDGGEIAFVRGDNDGTGLFLVHPDGSGVRKVADIAGGGVDAPAWSPDGTAIAFSTAVNYRYSPYSVQGREIFIVNADGSGQQRLTEGAPRYWTDSSPVWSPDGTQILYDRYRDRQRPYTMNSDGTCERKLVPDLDEGWSASWQPILGGPSGGPKLCHALSVEAVIQEWPAQITATVGNEGTEQLTDVVLLAPGATDVSLTSGQVESQRGTCLARLGSVTCRLPRLDRGEHLLVKIAVESRRVTYVNDPKPAGVVALETLISMSASQSLLETGRESDLLSYMIPFCTTRTAGGGVIRGTIYADHICGRKGADRILPGGGRDSVEAGAGPDVVFSAGDGRRDRISCGSGRDRVIADRRDRVARNCERVTRRR